MAPETGLVSQYLCFPVHFRVFSQEIKTNHALLTTGYKTPAPSLLYPLSFPLTEIHQNCTEDGLTIHEEGEGRNRTTLRSIPHQDDTCLGSTQKFAFEVLIEQSSSTQLCTVLDTVWRR